MTDWDQRMLTLAAHIATWSKDPSTQTGCVITRPDRTVAAMGYNGLPRGVADHPARLADRPTKYAMTVHAETNAILGSREPLHGCTAYITWPPCAACTGLLIQAGIREIVTAEANTGQTERWGDSMRHAATMCAEAGVGLTLSASRLKHSSTERMP